MSDEKWPNWTAPPFALADRPNLKATTPRVIDAVMALHTGKRRTVIQAGAHLGIWPAKLAAYFDRVVAFEPVLENWRCAVAAIQADNVVVIPAVLSDAVGVVSVSEPDKLYSGSARVSNKPGALFAPAFTIDAIQTLAGPVDAIFLDVEGHEGHVLRGAEVTVQRYRPTIVMEVLPKMHTGGGPSAILKRWGYRPVETLGPDQVWLG